MKLTINGRELEVEPGTTVIRAAEKAGIFVPHYCYHAGLSIAGNCRMCLVEIEKMPKLAIACSTVAAEGMVVRTDSPKVKEAQDAILEFLLINHPLDCPICDQAGECRLQEFAFQFGPARSRFLEEKNHGPKSVDLGRHIVFDSERCILCSRCVRFCQEVSKTGELAISHRGDHATIETYPGMRLDNPYSGNTVDICPVGALTLKEFRFQQRVWFLKDTPSVCAGCARGCNVLSGISKGRILRLTPRENQDVNRWWMCDEGRLSYTKLYGPSRIRWARVEGLTGAGAAGSLPTASEEGPVLPKLNEGVPPAPHPIGAMRPGETVMAVALEAAAKALEAARAAGRVEFVFSPRATNEDIYALGKLAKELFGADRAALPSFERGEDDFLLIRKDRSPNRAGALAILGGLGLAVEAVRGWPAGSGLGRGQGGRGARAEPDGPRDGGPGGALRVARGRRARGGDSARGDRRVRIAAHGARADRASGPDLRRARRDLHELRGPGAADPLGRGARGRRASRLPDRPGARPADGPASGPDRGAGDLLGARGGGPGLRRADLREARREGGGDRVRFDLFDLVATLVKIAVVFGGLMGSVVLMTWVERRVSGWIQDRLGPNRVGPFGLFQPLADGIKFLMKEDIIPSHVHKFVYVLAPAAALTTALTAFSVIPFGPTLTVFGREVALSIADVNVGVLVLLAVSSMGVYGIVMAGWSSNNKFSLMGGLRSSAQLISYELAMGLSVIGVLAASDTLRLGEIVERQAHFGWNIWMQPVGALIFLIASYAETNRVPFDLPEAESELVAGYHTEYSSMKFSMFFMAEYVNMATSAALFVTLFLGGWQVPGLWRLLSGNALVIGQVLGFVAKVAFFMFLFVWVRWTLPRFRYDQLMNLGWKVLIPLSIANIFWVGSLVTFGFYDRVQG